MKVKVEEGRCQGHARCFAEAPDVYVLDEFGYNTTDVDHVPEHLKEQARRGALACPEQALRIIEE